MQTYEIRVFPDPVLTQKSGPVEKFDDELRDLVNSMRLTMKVADGVGLAAPQIGILKRIALVSREGREYVLINPTLVDQTGSETKEEGCLSFPGIFAQVARPQWVRISAQNENGDVMRIEAEGVLARAILHEIDHLDGKVFIEYLSAMKRGMIRKKMQKRQKENA